MVGVVVGGGGGKRSDIGVRPLEPTTDDTFPFSFYCGGEVV